MNNQIEDVIEEFAKQGIPEFVGRELKIPTDLNKSIAIIGLRRVGKTYLLYQTMKSIIDTGQDIKGIFYINFEDERLSGFSVKDFTKIIEIFHKKNPSAKKGYIFLDEIQNIDGWEKFVRRLIEKKFFMVYVTGSSSKLLSKEIATSLRGRSISFHIFPFSFKEFLALKKFDSSNVVTERDRGLLKGHLDEYLAFGGFPEIAGFEKTLKIRVLGEYLDLIVYKDLVDRYGIEKIGAMKFLINSIARNFANEVSIRKLHNFLANSSQKLSKDKTYEYFSYLEDAGFVHPIRKFGRGFREIRGSVPKIYLNDLGFATIYGLKDIGRRLENIVALELLREKHYFKPLTEVHYWKNPQGREVDFVINRGRKVEQLIQVTYSSTKDEIQERELDALIKASDELKCRDLLVITWDYEAEEVFKGEKVRFVPLWKWLLK